MDKHTSCLFSGRKCNGMRAVIEGQQKDTQRNRDFCEENTNEILQM